MQKTKSKPRFVFCMTALALLLLSFRVLQKSKKPTVFIIGDSTVQNSDGNGRNAYWGWGSLIYPYFDTARISIKNCAKAGTSTRTFILDGRWDKIKAVLKKGDFVIMQFGHNDHAGVADTIRQKGTLLGIGEETKEIISIRTHRPETVHTYGWYLRKFITEAKTKGAIHIVCSLVPRNRWDHGKVVIEANYPAWAMAVAKGNGAFYINLNRIIAAHWVAIGRDSVQHFFPADGTHTNISGARLNALSVIEGLKRLKLCPLNNYLK